MGVMTDGYVDADLHSFEVSVKGEMKPREKGSGRSEVYTDRIERYKAALCSFPL